MATYNNKHWLLSHIRNSFISTDDTGMCETVMLSEDIPRLLAMKSKMHSPIPKPNDEFCCYPGLDQSEEDEEEDLWPSMEIHMDSGISYFHRSNTVQKLEKLNLARKKQSKIKTVRCDIVPPAGVNNKEMFVKKDVKGKVYVPNTKLGEQLAKCQVQAINKFLIYAQFDGSYQTSIATKKMKIFLTMLPEDSRNYPLEVCVIATAKIHEFIGLICYMCSISYPDVVLLTVKNYGLYIAEADGEIDTDFPPLDAREPCSKFCFSHLALIERRNSDLKTDTRAMSLTSEMEAEYNLDSLLDDTNRISTQQSEDLARMVSQQTLMEAPLYRSYRLKILTKGLFKADIQLGISGEKLEIDPVQTQNSKFWSRQKAISHNMDSIVWCEIIDDSSVHRVCFRIVYSHSPNNSDGGQPSSPVQHSNSSNTFRHYDFLTDALMAKEIIEKINHILDVRSTESRREYVSTHARTDRKSRKKTFLFK
ncbi:hypothetical protein HA402_000796 [Bradysia odoriphaga]|nr:hypothetical protein HA402_000796 [Bradysia odoriphaga]